VLALLAALRGSRRPVYEPRMFTARAATSKTVTAESADSRPIIAFARRDNGIVSVGLNGEQQLAAAEVRGVRSDQARDQKCQRGEVSNHENAEKHQSRAPRANEAATAVGQGEVIHHRKPRSSHPRARLTTARTANTSSMVSAAGAVSRRPCARASASPIGIWHLIRGVHEVSLPVATPACGFSLVTDGRLGVLGATERPQPQEVTGGRLGLLCAEGRRAIFQVPDRTASGAAAP
jgi:hypothetical protein